MLPRLDLPFRFHDPLDAVEAAIACLKPRKVERVRRDERRLTSFEFRCGKPDRYDFDLSVHDELGLLTLDVIRSDLARRDEIDL